MAKYLFIHIPKTAGVKTRHNIHMNANYPDTKVCIQEEGEDLRFFTDAELREFDIISGHFGFALRRRLEPDRRCITVLRKPLDRIVSGYYYWKTLDGKTWGREETRWETIGRLANSMSIYEFAGSTHEMIVEVIDNAQTWQIFWDYLRAARKKFAHCAKEEILAAAKRNLASLDFVGVQEDVGHLLGKMKARFDWRWTDEPSRKMNETPSYNPNDIDLELLRHKLGDRLVLDEALYSFALELYGQM